MFELGAVRHMQVRIDDRIPGVDQPQQGACLRRVGLHIVAVQIVVLGRGADAALHRSALIGPVPAAETFVTVRIIDRDEQDHLFLQRARGDFTLQQLAQGQIARVLAIDLAGVNAALDQNDRQTAFTRRLWRQGAAARNRQRMEGSSFRRRAEGEGPHGVRIGRSKGGVQRRDLGITAGMGEAGPLRLGDKRRIEVLRQNGGGPDLNQQGQQPRPSHRPAPCPAANTDAARTRPLFNPHQTTQPQT